MIVIQNSAFQAVIDLHRGGNCISLCHKASGAQLLRQRPAGELDNPYLYGMPILFPVNRISGGSFSFEGREYVFPINEPATGCHLHGTLHETPFSLLEQESHRLVCAYQAEAGQYLQFPHAFEIRMEYELTGDGMYHRTWVVNRSDTNMPVMLGFHTTFNARFLPDTMQTPAVRVPVTEEYERNMQTYLPTGRKPAPDEVSRQLHAGSFNPFSQPISRHYRSTGNMTICLADHVMTYENDEKFLFRLIYNGQADGYICLEPQNCLANCANAPVSRQEAGFDYITPGGFRQYTSKITLQQGGCV